MLALITHDLGDEVNGSRAEEIAWLFKRSHSKNIMGLEAIYLVMEQKITLEEKGEQKVRRTARMWVINNT